MKKLNKKILSITQILILLIGILAFNYIIGEIGKQRGIEVSRGVGFVSAQTTTCESNGGTCATSCSDLTLGGKWEFSLAGVCELGSGKVCCKPAPLDDKNSPDQIESSATATDTSQNLETFDERYYAEWTDKDGNPQTTKIPNSIGDEKDQAKKEKDLLAYLGEGVGVLGTIDSAVKYGKKGAEALSISSPKEIPKETVKKTAEGLEKKTPGKWSTFLKSQPFGEGMSVKGILNTAAIAFASAELYVLIFKLAGASDRNLRDLQNAAIASALGVTIASTALAASGAFATGGALASLAAGAGTALAGGPAGWVIAGAVVIIMGIYTLFGYKQYYQEIFNYVPGAWKAEDGGKFCDKCNDLKYGCSEYQCRSFGKACEIENKGTTQEGCIWKNSQDAESPIITPLEKILPENYAYEPVQVASPPSTGVKLIYIGVDKDENNCLVPYTAVTLGIETDELAGCKIDTQRTDNYENMLSPMAEGSILTKEHLMYIPHAATASAESLENAGITEITNGQEQQFYIRCKDANGNENPLEFLMQFCVQAGPDTSAPMILGTNFLETSYLQYNQTDAYLEVYTNEPAECKWGFDDLAYDNLQNDMSSSCSSAEGDYLYPETFQYGCQGTLTGLKDRIENEVYIKCKDKPWWEDGMKGQRYENQESFKLTLRGTEPLIIDKITVNDKNNGAVIKDSVNTIKAALKVTSKFGAQQGKARCQYDQGGNFVDFYNEGNIGFVNVNNQNLYLSEGDYNISIRCSDAGGNSDKGNIEFSIETDRESPIVARAYYDVNNLKVITNEPAECVYTLQTNIGCAYEFADGTAMSDIGELTHYTSWQAGKKYFIKCKDAFGNQPLPGQCGIIVKAFESYD